MKTSETTAKVFAALIAAQAEIPAIHRDRENSHFRNKYATLDAIVDAVRPVLARHGLAVMSGVSVPHTSEAGTLLAFAVSTRLVHTSGEWVESSVILPIAKNDPQGAGSAVTYGRRYSLSALLSLATDDDDDGEQAVGRDAPAKPATRASAPAEAKRPAPAAAPAKAAVATNSYGDPLCPVCHGKMWDNREGKKNPKAPDYKCRDKACDGVYWPGEVTSASSRPTPAPDLSEVNEFDDPSDEMPF